MKRFEFHVTKSSRRITSWEPKYQNIFLKKLVETRTFSCKADLMQEALEIMWACTKLAQDSWSDFQLEEVNYNALDSARKLVSGLRWAVANKPEIKQIVDASTVKFDEDGDVVFENWPKIKIAYLKAVRGDPSELKGDQKVIKFFSELNGMINIGLAKIYPLVPEQWRDGAEWVEKEKKSNNDLEPKDKFNATSIHNIGSKISLNGREDEVAERFASSDVPKMEKAINDALEDSELDIQYFGKKIYAKVVNGAFPALVTKADYSDDGDDEYGVKLLWKFSYSR